MLRHTPTKNDHTSFLRVERDVVQLTDILDNIDHKSRIAKRVEVEHIAQRAIC